jgi:hypothetical protein
MLLARYIKESQYERKQKHDKGVFTMSPYAKNAKKNKNLIPNLKETRFATTDNRYLEGDGEEEVLASQMIAEENRDEKERDDK